ncbi:MAG: hypothetical protein ABI878_08000 [Acidobacteriota bacterium]
MKKAFCLPFIILLASVALRASTEETGAWSGAVSGLRGRLIVKDGETFHGTRLPAVYLELENVSDVGNQMEFFFDPMGSIESSVTDAAGKEVEQSPTPADILSPGPFWLALPNDGSLRFRISVSGYGIFENSGTDIQMSSGNWIIKPADKNKYYLAATFESKPPASDRRRAWTGSLKLPRVLIPH